MEEDEGELEGGVLDKGTLNRVWKRSNTGPLEERNVRQANPSPGQHVMRRRQQLCPQTRAMAEAGGAGKSVSNGILVLLPTEINKSAERSSESHLRRADPAGEFQG